MLATTHVYFKSNFLQSHGLIKNDSQQGCLGISFSVPEVKILILLSYFIVFGIMTLVNFSILIHESSHFSNDLARYFVCQLNGYDPTCEDYRREFEKHLSPEVNSTTYLLIGLTTWVHLLFVIQIQDVKKLIKRIMSKFKNDTI